MNEYTIHIKKSSLGIIALCGKDEHYLQSAPFHTAREAVSALFDMMEKYPIRRSEDDLLNLKLDCIIELLNRVHHDD